MIRTEELVKSFGALQVLRGITLHVRPGEIFGFVGPNGAGKTTFLKCLLGVVVPDGGRAFIDGVDVIADSLGGRRRTGFAPGEIALYNRMRVRELLDFALAFHARADRRWAFEQLERFGVPASTRVGKLSHGMKRKVLLVQALAVDTPLVLLDEPMEGLDPEARLQAEALLRENAARGRTIFFSSHDLASVERVCDRVAFLRSGRLMEVGCVATLLERAGHVLQIVLERPIEAAELPSGPGFRWTGGERRWRLEFEGGLGAALRRIAGLPLTGIRDASGGLVEVFEALYGPENHAEKERA